MHWCEAKMRMRIPSRWIIRVPVWWACKVHHQGRSFFMTVQYMLSKAYHLPRQWEILALNLNLLPEWIHNALPQNTADFLLCTICGQYEKYGIEDITQTKQPKHSGIQVAGILVALVALYPSFMSQILFNLLRINMLITELFKWNMTQSWDEKKSLQRVKNCRL